MSWIIFIFQGLYFKKKDEIYKKIAQFWIKIFTISFVTGVATGIILEFEFGTNWAEYSRFVGDIFGAPLAAEALFAFFLESTFIGILIWGRKRVSEKFYWFSTLMVAFGSSLSGLWIIIANSWMQTPAGFEIVNGRAELVDFYRAALNYSTLPRYFHTITACLITGAFFMAGISAYYLLKKRHVEFARKSLYVCLSAALAFSVIQGALGHWHAQQVAKTQPEKLAVIEGHWDTSTQASLLIFGIPDPENEITRYAVGIPGGLGFLAFNDFNAEVKGLKEFPLEERPPVFLPFYSFHLMVALGGYFILLSAVGLFLFKRKEITEQTGYLKILLFSMALPLLANELGWIVAEVGRQPWIVYRVMRTAEAFSANVSPDQILASIIGFTLIFSVILGLWIFLVRRMVLDGPDKLHEVKEAW